VQISIHPKVIKTLLILGTLTVLGIAFFAVRPLIHKPYPTPTKSWPLDAQVAVEAATTFYTMDFTADPILWATKVCTLTTEAGCHVIQEFFAPSVWAMVQKNKIQTDCDVTPVRLVSESGSLRVWQVRVALTHPWPGLDKSEKDVFIEVEKTNDIWLMTRILFQQEAKEFLTPTP
jgi:hypothetical protein